MKKNWLLLCLVFVMAIPQNIVAQSTEDQIRTIGAGIGILGRMIENGINKRKEREKREEEIRKEYENQKREYQEWVLQKEAAAREEKRKAEEARRQEIEEENKKAEEARKRAEDESQVSTFFQEYWISEEGESHLFNSWDDKPLVTARNWACFYTNNGEYVQIWLQDKHPCYYNSGSKEKRFICNKVIGIVKFYSDDLYYKLEDSFSILMSPQKAYLMNYKEVFPLYSLSIEDIEVISIYFAEEVRIQ